MRHRSLLIAGAATFGLLGPVLAPAVHAQDAASIDSGEERKADPAPDVEVSTTGSYIVVMVDEPLIATIDQDDLDSPAAAAEAAEIEADHDVVLAESGVSTAEKVQDYTNALNGFSATISHAQAVKLASHPDVAHVIPDELRQLTTDSSGDFLGLTGRGEAYASGLTGEDVVVGVIDSGIWPEHPSFADDGSYSDLGIVLDESVYSACDFGNTAHNPNDAPFECNNKLIGARQTMATYRALIGADPDEFNSARDDDGHGTHTASTAAGNADVEASIFGKDLGTVTGIAPRARVIAYKGLGNLGGFGSDLAASIDQAVADGVDVINYSVGGGASASLGPDDIAFLFAADAGVHVATSAGNSGPGAETIGGPAHLPWVTTVGANTQKRFWQGTVVLRHFTEKEGWGRNDGYWSTGGRVKGASVTTELRGRTPLVDAEFAGGDLCIPGTLDPAAVEGAVVLCRRGAIARVDKSRAVLEAGGLGMVLYQPDDESVLISDTHWVPSVHVNNTDGLEIKEYIAEQPNPTAAIRKTAKATKLKDAPFMAEFSSRGANGALPDLIKPDITAPGVQILAGGSPFPDPGSVPGELFQAIQGTSMSSPHVAGVFALLKQAHPDWTPAMVKSAIMTSADPHVHDNDMETDATPFARGAGHLDPGKVDKKGSAFNPGIVYDAGFFEYLGFLCGAAPDNLSPTTCPFLESIGVPTDPSDLNLASIGIAELAGSQTVTRTMTNVSGRALTMRPHVDAPAGYHVHVTPDKVKLQPGESATYQVSIVNDGSGPVGEWRFGSMTWKGNGYQANSPIAVRGALIGTPAEVAGVGADGSTSFDIQFGYSGPYTAAPHGLSAEVLLSGTIGQDPDQSYTPGEVGPGVERHDIDLNGAAFARIELVIPGDDDIDLFLEDPAGNIVASSTSGGTDELIELTLPAGGVYTLVVHGWSVPSEPLPYDISTWVVPLASGGSLVVDSAPASATVGATGTIDVSWSGAAAGTSLGAVSHSDGSGLIGLTLVEVQN